MVETGHVHGILTDSAIITTSATAACVHVGLRRVRSRIQDLMEVCATEPSYIHKML